MHKVRQPIADAALLKMNGLLGQCLDWQCGLYQSWCLHGVTDQRRRMERAPEFGMHRVPLGTISDLSIRLVVFGP